MRIIVGLGNPGLRYRLTRHNLGFWVVDELSRRWQIPLTRHKFQAHCGQGAVGDQKVMLFKPQTFMNLSGESVGPAASFYRVLPDRILIICDDLDLIPGLIRIRGSGSAGGHKGLQSIITHLKSDRFPRLRLGIGAAPSGTDSAGYVLQGIEEPDLRILKDASVLAADAVEMWLAEGLTEVMNQYNRKQNKAT